MYSILLCAFNCFGCCIWPHVIAVMLNYELCILQFYSLLYFCLLVFYGNLHTAHDQLVVNSMFVFFGLFYTKYGLMYEVEVGDSLYCADLQSVLTENSNLPTMQRDHFAIMFVFYAHKQQHKFCSDKFQRVPYSTIWLSWYTVPCKSTHLPIWRNMSLQPGIYKEFWSVCIF